MIKVNQCGRCMHQTSFSAKLIVRTHRRILSLISQNDLISQNECPYLRKCNGKVILWGKTLTDAHTQIHWTDYCTGTTEVGSRDYIVGLYFTLLAVNINELHKCTWSGSTTPRVRCPEDPLTLTLNLILTLMLLILKLILLTLDLLTLTLNLTLLTLLTLTLTITSE